MYGKPELADGNYQHKSPMFQERKPPKSNTGALILGILIGIVIIGAVVAALAFGTDIFEGGSNGNGTKAPVVGVTNAPTLSPVVGITDPPTDPPVVGVTNAPTLSPVFEITDPPTDPPVVGVTNAPTLSPVATITNAPTQSPVQSPIDSGTCVDGVEARAPGAYVGVLFQNCPSQSVFDAFVSAANRWSSLITQNRISPTTLGFTLDIEADCGLEGADFTFPPETPIDHLTIFANVELIDGVNGILAQAGPCTFVPGPLNEVYITIGVMQFDSADLNALDAEGLMETVVLHEMGHVLGLGTLWSILRQGGSFADLVNELLLQDPIFEFDQFGNFFANADNVPKFVGANGIAEFEALAGANEPFVPVEDGRDENGVQQFNINAGQGIGSIDGHWKKTTFDNELMTFQLNPNDPEFPMSKVTISSLQDLGLAVDVNQADDYSLPTRRKSLRGDEKMVDLSHDIILPKKFLQMLAKYKQMGLI